MANPSSNRQYLKDKLAEYYGKLAEAMSQADDASITRANALTCKIQSVEMRLQQMDSVSEVVEIPNLHVSGIRFFNQ